MGCTKTRREGGSELAARGLLGSGGGGVEDLDDGIPAHRGTRRFVDSDLTIFHCQNAPDDLVVVLGIARIARVEAHEQSRGHVLALGTPIGVTLASRTCSELCEERIDLFIVVDPSGHVNLQVGGLDCMQD
jgi:hypothetical protein